MYTYVANSYNMGMRDLPDIIICHFIIYVFLAYFYDVMYVICSTGLF